MRNARTALFVFTFLAAIVAFGGCGGATGGGAGPAQILFVHASPDAPALDFRVDGSVVFGNRAYLSISPYQSVAPGLRLLTTARAGDSAPLLENTENLQADTRYSYLVVDFLDFLLEPVLLVNEVAGVPSGQVRVRFLHACPTEAVTHFDVYVTEPGADLANQTPVFRNVDFLIPTDYATLPAGNRQVRMTLAGSTDVIVDSGEISLASGQVRTILAVEQPSEGDKYFMLLVPEN